MLKRDTIAASAPTPVMASRGSRRRMEPVLRHRHLMIAIAAAASFTFLLAVATPAPTTPLTVIQLNHRTADEIIPIITPFLAAGDTLSGEGFLLFVGAAPERLTRLREMVAHLDQAPRQLLITVVQGENAVATLQRLSISGNVNIGDDVSVSNGKRHSPENRLDVRVQEERRRQASNDIQQVRVQSGQPATISVALSAPVPDGVLRHGGMRYHAVEGYRQLWSGVRIVPHLSGNRVILDIEARDDRPAGGGQGPVRHQAVQTRVQGSVGEWIEIGTLLGQTHRSAAGLDGAGRDMQQHGNQIFIKVEESP